MQERKEGKKQKGKLLTIGQTIFSKTLFKCVNEKAVQNPAETQLVCESSTASVLHPAITSFVHLSVTAANCVHLTGVSHI